METRGWASGVGYGSLARFFNSANARPARRPSLVAVEFEFLGVVGAARLECGEPAAEPVGSMFQNSNSEIIVPNSNRDPFETSFSMKFMT